MEKPSVPAAYAALTDSALVWGGSIVGQKLALGAFSVVETSLLRGIGALAILIPLWWWTEGGRTTLTARDLKLLSLLGLGVLGNHLLTLFGLRYIGASTAGRHYRRQPGHYGVPFFSVGARYSLQSGRRRLRSLLRGSGARLGSRRRCSQRGQSLVGRHAGVIGVGQLGVVLHRRQAGDGAAVSADRQLDDPVALPGAADSSALDRSEVAVDRHKCRAGLRMAGIRLSHRVRHGLGTTGLVVWGARGGALARGVFVNLIPVSALFYPPLVLGEAIGVREVAGIVLILAGVWLVGWQSARLKSDH